MTDDIKKDKLEDQYENQIDKNGNKNFILNTDKSNVIHYTPELGEIMENMFLSGKEKIEILKEFGSILNHTDYWRLLNSAMHSLVNQSEKISTRIDSIQPFVNDPKQYELDEFDNLSNKELKRLNKIYYKNFEFVQIWINTQMHLMEELIYHDDFSSIRKKKIKLNVTQKELGLAFRELYDLNYFDISKVELSIYVSDIFTSCKPDTILQYLKRSSHQKPKHEGGLFDEIDK